MMHLSILSALAALTIGSLAAPSNTRRHVLHERRDESAGWVKAKRASGDVVMPMRIGLTQSNLHLGPDLLMEVSDPASTKFGQYYTTEQVHDIFAPSAESVESVRSWLHSAGIDPERISHSVNKQWLQFDAKVEEAEQLLKTQYHIYENPFTGRHSLGCDEYHVHGDVKRHIDYITPGVKTITLKSVNVETKAKRSFKSPNGWIGPVKKPLPADLTAPTLAANPLQNCDKAITPPCVRAMYNFTATTTAQPGNQLGIFEDGDFYDQNDLNLFFKKYATNIASGTHPTLNGIDGGMAPQGDGYEGGESLLDFELAYPIVYPQNITLYQTDDSYYTSHFGEYAGYFNTFLDGIDGSYCTYSAYGETGNSAIDPVYPDPNSGGYKGKLQCGAYKPTNVISLSYGLAETGADIPSNYQQRQCSEYMKLGMQGHSIVFASGDQGVGSAYGCLGSNGNVFSPDFPSNCPWVTSAGSVFLPPGASAAKDQEVATTSFPSGGGFSNVFARPSYQSSAVKAFFKSPGAPTYPYYTGSTYGSGIYNRTGRGYPDVAAVGDNIVLYVEGAVTMEGGTSASTPTFASILTRINDARLKAGKSTIGFVNPTLYANPSAFHDITVGTNPNCNSNGFNATVGWDPVTGLGTPNYPALLNVFMALP